MKRKKRAMKTSHLNGSQKGRLRIGSQGWAIVLLSPIIMCIPRIALADSILLSDMVVFTDPTVVLSNFATRNDQLAELDKFPAKVLGFFAFAEGKQTEKGNFSPTYKISIKQDESEASLGFSAPVPPGLSDNETNVELLEGDNVSDRLQMNVFSGTPIHLGFAFFSDSTDEKHFLDPVADAFKLQEQDLLQDVSTFVLPNVSPLPFRVYVYSGCPGGSPDACSIQLSVDVGEPTSVFLLVSAFALICLSKCTRQNLRRSQRR